MRHLFLLLPLILSAPVIAAPVKVPAKTAAKAPVRAKVMPNSTLRAALRAAIDANDAALVAALMKRGARPDSELLDLALYREHLATWKALFAGGVRADARVEIYDYSDAALRAPLIVALAQRAAQNGDASLIELLRLVIARGADVNARAANGWSALEVATQIDVKGTGAAAQILLDAGAKVAPDDAPLLAYAARIANPKLLQNALQAGVSPTSAAARKLHLLQTALDVRRFQDENGPFNPNAPSAREAANPRRAQVVQMLLDAGVSPNDLDENGQTPLMLAADGGLRPDLVELLLGRGADPNLRRAPKPAPAPPSAPARRTHYLQPEPTIWDYAFSVRRFTARQIADGLALTDEAFGFFPLEGGSFRAPTVAEVTARQAPEITRTLELLLDTGAALEVANERGETALLLAAKANRGAAIQFLLARGAAPRATDKAGNSALHLAAGTDSPDAVAALLEAGAAEAKGAKAGGIEADGAEAKGAEANGAEANGAEANGAEADGIEARNASGLTPLLLAAGAGVGGTTFYGPLSMSVEGYSGGPEALRALVERGADPGARDGKGQTALHWMARHGDTKSAQLLIQRGADVNASAPKGVTPLHIAVAQGDYSMAKLLLSLGADASLRGEGQTALDIARAPFHTKMNVVGEDPAHPSPETRAMLAKLAQNDRQVTLRRREIARLLERAEK